MKLKHILSASILSLAFVSCSSEMEEATGGHGVPLQITANIEDTRAAGVEDKGFNKDEMIGLYVNNQIHQAVYNGSSWDIQSEDIMLSDKEQTVYAYYNGDKKEAATRAINVDKTEIVEAVLSPTFEINAGTNCLVADPVKVSASNSIANLHFKHVMARVSFVVTRTNSDCINSMYISGDNVYTTATCGLFDKSVFNAKTATVTIKEPPMLPVAPSVIIGSHAKDEVQETIDALLIPAPAGEATITLDVNNKKYTTTVSLPELKMGGYYRLPINLEEQVVELDANGHEYVDLGLPSGTLWATCNVGATSQEESGDYYSWGETTTKERFYNSDYKWYDANTDLYTKYVLNEKYGTIDNKTELEPDDDVAHVVWGGDWRMPTEQDVEELMNNARWYMDEKNSVYGYTIVSNKNSNSIFLPFAGGRFYSGVQDSNSQGCYWTKNVTSYYGATYLSIKWDEKSMGGWFRQYGLSVRPVLGK